MLCAVFWVCDVDYFVWWRQAPLLLSGTVRSNLDPFSEHDDITLLSVLNRCGLGGDSDGKVAQGGT